METVLQIHSCVPNDPLYRLFDDLLALFNRLQLQQRWRKKGSYTHTDATNNLLCVVHPLWSLSSLQEWTPLLEWLVESSRCSPSLLHSILSHHGNHFKRLNAREGHQLPPWHVIYHQLPHVDQNLLLYEDLQAIRLLCEHAKGSSEGIGSFLHAFYSHTVRLYKLILHSAHSWRPRKFLGCSFLLLSS